MVKINNIAYIGINSSYSHSMLAYGKLRAWAESHGIKANWHEFTRTIKDYDNGLVAEIIDADVQIVFATCYLFNVETVVKVLAMIKAICPEIVIAVGGPEFLGDNEKFLRRYSFVDYCVRGDESSLHNFLKQLEGNIDFKKNISATGLCYLDDVSKYIDNGCALFEGNADELPSLYEMRLFSTNKAFVQYETSRGCPNQCSFCTSSLSSNKLLLHSVERVRRDLKIIQTAGIKEIRLLDRTFNANKRRTITLLKMFIEEFSDMRFHLEIYPALVDEEICEILASAKKDQLHVEVGVQSLNKNILHACKRNFKVEKTLDGIRQLLTVNKFEIHGDLLSGLPEQRLSDIFYDVYGLMRLKVDEIQLEVLKILPGTPIAELLPEGHCFNPLTPYQVLKTKFLSVKDLAIADDLSKLLDSFYNNEKIQYCFTKIMQINLDQLLKFCIFYRKHNSGMQKLAINKRFDILSNFIEEDQDICKNLDYYWQLLKFCWLKQALPPEKFGYKVMKNQTALFPHKDEDNISEEMEALIAQLKNKKNCCDFIADNKQCERASRFCLVKFDYDFMDKSGDDSLDNNVECYYIFRFLHGQRLHSVTRIKMDN